MVSELAGRLLLVDDDIDLLTILPIALNQLDAEITTVSSGEQALIKVTEHDYSAIILDVDLGVMNGFDVARRIRSTDRSCRTPILFVTGNSSDSISMGRGYQVGGVDYLSKPVELDVLIAKLRVFIDLDRELRRISCLNATLVQEASEVARATTRAKTLQGILAICAYCHRIRDEACSWQALETYITQRSEAQFSHGICPGCFDVHLRDELDRSKTSP